MKKTQISLYLAATWLLFMMGMDITAPNLILPKLQTALSLNSNSSSWFIILYLLFYVGSIIPGGRLGDSLQHKTVLMTGISIFALASVMIGCAGSVWLLFLGRALQGIGAGCIWPNLTAMVFQSFKKQQLALGIGLFASVMGLSLATGPVAAGLLIHVLSWRAVFLINAPFCLLAFMLIVFLKNRTHTQRNPVDFTGAVILILTLMSCCFAISKLNLFAAVIAVFGGWIFYQQQKRSYKTIIPVSLIQNTDFKIGCLQRVLVTMPFYIILFMFGSAFQHQWHLNALQAGVAFLPMTLTIGVLSPVGGKLIDRFGISNAAICTALCYMAGFIALLFCYQNSSILTISLLLILPGMAFAVGSPMSMTQSLHSLPTNQHGTASGIFYMVSLLSGVIGVSCSSLLQRHWSALYPSLILCLVLGIIIILVASENCLAKTSLLASKNRD